MSTNDIFEKEELLKEDASNNSQDEIISKDKKDDNKATNEEIYKIEIFKDEDEIEDENNGIDILKQRKSSEKYIVPILVVAFIIAFAGIALLVRNISKANEPVNEAVIYQSTEYVNNSNFINVNRTTILDGQTFNVNKILVDSMATIVRFTEEIDLSEFEITLIDNFNNEYFLDSSFYTLDEPIVSADNLRFEPFIKPIESFIIRFTNVLSNKSKELDFVFGTDFVMPKRKEINFDKIKIENENPPEVMEFSIEDGIFTSSGSTIYYAIKSNLPNTSIEININSEEKMISLNLIEGAKTISTDKKNFIKQEYSQSNNTSYGRIDFAAIKNLNSKLKLVIDEIYNKININKLIEATELLDYNNNPDYFIEFGDYTLVLERMRYFEDKYILVAHATQKNHVNKGKEEIIKLDMNINLLTKNKDGEDVSIKGDVMVSRSGTDIVFDFLDEDIDGGSKAYLLINSVSFKLKPVHVSIDLDD